MQFSYEEKALSSACGHKTSLLQALCGSHYKQGQKEKEGYSQLCLKAL